MRATIAVPAAVLVVLAACKKDTPPAAAPPADLGAAAAAQSLAAIVASCAAARGEVQVKRGGQGEWQAIATGGVFRAGDVVRTGAGAFVRVEFVAGGALELDEGAEVVIDLAPAAAGGGAPEERRISVEKGVVRGFMPADVTAAPLVLRTGDGNDVRLTAAAPGEKPVQVRLTRRARGTEVAVTSGQVKIVGASGEKALGAGKAADLSGAGAGDVIELVQFPVSAEPGIDARFRYGGDLTIRLAWKPADGAARYRVQIARDIAFQSVESTFDVDATEASLSPRSEGMYAWRVASRDAAGRLGEYGFARRIYFEKEEPQDLLVGPPEGHLVKYSEKPPQLEFTWQSAGSHAAYVFVLATGPDLLEDKLIGMDGVGQRVELPAPNEGAYYWGVYVKTAEGPSPIFVRARKLVVQKLAKPKVKVPSKIDKWGN